MIKITLPLMSMKDWRWNYLFLWQLDFYFSYYILILLICIALKFLRLPRQLLHYLTICTFYPCFAPYHFSYTLLTSPLNYSFFLSLYLSFSLSLYFYHFTFLFSFRPLPPIHLSYYSTIKGIGALAGSTIMLLTIPWCLSIIGGRVDIDPKTKLARYVYHHSSFYFSLFQTISLFYVFFYFLCIEWRFFVSALQVFLYWNSWKSWSEISSSIFLFQLIFGVYWLFASIMSRIRLFFQSDEIFIEIVCHCCNNVFAGNFFLSNTIFPIMMYSVL